jgi:threonine/homoserine/homoserine lactone efflux protein
MSSYYKIYFAGLVISFLGSLPLGSLNIAAMQIAVQETVRKALLFAFGVALVELIYVRLSLKGISWILANQMVFYILEWVTVVLFIILAVSSFIAAGKPEGKQKNLLLNNSVNRFWLGITMSAINPVQIPFWFLWSSYLFSIHWLDTSTASSNIYIIGIGTGTISGLLLFIYAGKWLVSRLNAGQRTINIAVGLVFLLSGILQLTRVLRKPMDSRYKTVQTSVRTERLHSYSARLSYSYV